MNCDCRPPQLAVLRTVQKPGPNQGKEFFVCPAGNCKYFQWALQGGPPSLGNRSFLQSNSVQNRQVHQRYSITATIEVKSFDFTHRPVRVWLKLFFPFCQRLLDFLHRNPRDKCCYDNQLKMWVFDFTYYEQIVSGIFSLSIESFQLKELPKFLQVGLSNFLSYINKIPAMQEEDLKITPDLMETLLPFQVEGIKFVISRGGRALIGDEMGCGKTVQAIALLQHYRHYWPALILMPVALVDQWKGELLQYSSAILKDSDICIIRKGSDRVFGHITIVPYSMIEKLVETNRICPDQFGIVIADESHNIKSGDAKRTTCVVPFLKRAQVSICLTGTPAVNRPVELYTQLNGLLPSVFFSYDQFVERYCDAKPQRFNANILDVKGSSNEIELKALLEGMVMIRRLKADVVASLPEKRREIRYVDADITFAAEINRIKKRQTLLDSKLKDFTLDDSERSKISFEQKQLLLRFYQVTGLSKVKAIKNELYQRINESRLERKLEKSLSEESYGIEALSKQHESDFNLSVADSDYNKDVILMELEPDLVTTDQHISELTTCKTNFDDILIDTDEEDCWPHKVKLHRKKKRAREGRLDFEEAFALYQNEEDRLFCSDDEVIDLCNSPILSPSKDKPTVRNRKHCKRIGDEVDCESLTELDNLVLGKSVGKKILVFGHHHEVLNGIEESLREAQVGYIRIDGSTSKSKKAALIQKFQTCPSVDVAVLSITACGTGLNLTVANIAIFAELYWSPGVVLQAEDRIHRIGQLSKEVKLIYILARNTADDVVWEQIQKKYSVLGATIGNADGIHHFSHATVTSTKSGHERVVSENTGGVALQRRIDDYITPIHTDLRPYEKSSITINTSSNTDKKIVAPMITSSIKRNDDQQTNKIQSTSISATVRPDNDYCMGIFRHHAPSITESKTDQKSEQCRNVYDPRYQQSDLVYDSHSTRKCSDVIQFRNDAFHANRQENDVITEVVCRSESGIQPYYASNFQRQEGGSVQNSVSHIDRELYENHYQYTPTSHSETLTINSIQRDLEIFSTENAPSFQHDIPPVITSCVHAPPIFMSENSNSHTTDEVTRHQKDSCTSLIDINSNVFSSNAEINKNVSSSKALPLLTPEIMARIEKNKQEALRKRAMLDQGKLVLNANRFKTGMASSVVLNQSSINFAHKMFS